MASGSLAAMIFRQKSARRSSALMSRPSISARFLSSGESVLRYSASRSRRKSLGQERDELLHGDVARIVEGDAGDVHLLVVAEEHVDHASRRGRFLLEAHEEIEDLLGPGAPVHDVAELDEMGLAAGPVEVVVDEADLGVGEDEDEAVVVAVEVGDGHDPVDARPFVGDLGGRGGGGAGRRGPDRRRKNGRRLRRTSLRMVIGFSFLYSRFPGANQGPGRFDSPAPVLLS